MSDTDIRRAVIAAYSRQLLDSGKSWVPDGIDTLSATYVDLAFAAIQAAGYQVVPADNETERED